MFKLKEVSRKILSGIYNFFEGSGIGKIPGVFSIFLHISNFFLNGKTIEMNGQKFSLSNDPVTNKRIISYYYQGHEPNVTSLFYSLVEKGMTVVDVGANFGYFTILAAKLVGNEGLVLAFEPEPTVYKALIKNIQVNNWNNVRPLQLAVGDLNGKEFNISPNVNPLETISLDSFLQTDVDIVKIDVEGGELEVLRGMKNILAKGKVKIICEVHPAQLSSLGYSTKEIEELLRQYDYNIYLITEKREPKLIPIAETLKEERRHYLFTKEVISNGRTN